MLISKFFAMVYTVAHAIEGKLEGRIEVTERQ